MREHKPRWFVYAGGYGQPLVKIPHQASMRGHWPGYDVECSCGWGSKTGGAIKPRVVDALFDHRYSAQVDKELRAEAHAQGIDPDDQVAFSRFLRDKVMEAQS